MGSLCPLFCLQESESEDDMLDLGDEEVDEEHEHESEAPVHSEPVVTKAPEVPAPPKETERQLSKKERKKKELEELEALLADFGLQSSNGQGMWTFVSGLFLCHCKEPSWLSLQ